MLLEYECAICLDTNNQKINYTCIQCNKHFHKSCLSEWFKYTKNCPSCRYSSPENDFDPNIIEIFIIYLAALPLLPLKKSFPNLSLPKFFVFLLLLILACYPC